MHRESSMRSVPSRHKLLLSYPAFPKDGYAWTIIEVEEDAEACESLQAPKTGCKQTPALQSLVMYDDGHKEEKHQKDVRIVEDLIVSCPERLEREQHHDRESDVRYTARQETMPSPRSVPRGFVPRVEVDE